MVTDVQLTTAARVQKLFTQRRAGTISLAEFQKQVETLETEELLQLSKIFSRYIQAVCQPGTVLKL